MFPMWCTIETAVGGKHWPKTTSFAADCGRTSILYCYRFVHKTTVTVELRNAKMGQSNAVC